VAIFGHDRVLIVKVPQRQLWEVRVVHKDPAHQHLLVEVKWEDAFKDFPYAKDYGEAVRTCQYDERFALTEEEEDLVHDLNEGRITRAEYEMHARPKPPPPEEQRQREEAASRILSMDEFRRRKGR
jgi:hypothetical protein